MMPRTGALLLGAVALACSGRYQVGGMMDHAGADGSGDSASVAGSSPLGNVDPPNGGSAASAGNASTDPNAQGELGTSCVPLGAPAPLSGPFVDGATLWSRIAPLIRGEVTAPPEPLAVDYAYADIEPLVRQAFAQSRAETGGAPGALTFVAEWLRRDGEDMLSLSGAWDSLLADDAPALPLLLQTRLAGTGRIGVFTEPQWLMRHRNISARGAGISYSLFQLLLPLPPAGLPDMAPDPQLTDRAALEQRLQGEPACRACHAMMDPLGYPLGNFDSAGEYRDLDHGQALDVTGSYSNPSVPFQIQYDGLMDFGVKVADTCVANRALASGLVSFVLRQRNVAAELRQQLLEENLERLAQAFIRSGRSYPDLVVAYAQSPLALRP